MRSEQAQRWSRSPTETCWSLWVRGSSEGAADTYPKKSVAKIFKAVCGFLTGGRLHGVLRSYLPLHQVCTRRLLRLVGAWSAKGAAAPKGKIQMSHQSSLWGLVVSSDQPHQPPRCCPCVNDGLWTPQRWAPNITMLSSNMPWQTLAPVI